MSTPNANQQPNGALTPPPAATPADSGFWSGMSKPYKVAFMAAGSVLALSGGWIGMKQFSTGPAIVKADEKKKDTSPKDDKPKEPKDLSIDDPMLLIPSVKGHRNSSDPATIEAPPIPQPHDSRPRNLPSSIKDDFNTANDIKLPPIPGEVPSESKSRRENNDVIIRTGGQDKPPALPPVPPIEEIPSVPSPKGDTRKDPPKIDEIVPPLPKIGEVNPPKVDATKVEPPKVDITIPVPSVKEPLKVDIKDPVVPPASKIDTDIKPPKVEVGPTPKIDLKVDIPPVNEVAPPPPPSSLTIAPDRPKTSDPVPTIKIDIPSIPATGSKEPPAIPPTTIRVDPIDARPVTPAPTEVKRDNYEEDWHTLTGKETYEEICKLYYSGATEYAAALESYNKERKKSGENIIRVPPTWVLKEKYPALVETSERRNTGTVRPTSSVRVDPVDNRNDFRPPPAASNVSSAPSVSEEYRVKIEGGERIKEIARKVLGDPNQWRRIYDLNPNIDPTEPIPVGTTLRLPR